MIVFVGHKEKGFFCKEVAAKKEMECAYIAENLHIADQSKEILQYKDTVKFIIYELEQYTDDPEVIEEWILKIQDAIHIKTILFVPGYSPDSRVVYGLYQKGIRNFIFPIYLGEQKEDLELCMDGYFETFGYESRGIVFEKPEEEEKEDEVVIAGVKSIGLAGAVPRMGTTTQSIQMVKYLQFMGHRAAYVQMNGHHFVEDLADSYTDARKNQEEGVVNYQGVDLFYRLDKLQEILKKGYEFLVYDYGAYSEHDFNKISFLEKDVQIFVVGSKPGEFEKTYEVVKNNFYSDIYYIFNFVALSEQKDLKELMDDKATYTFFAEEARDPFAFSGEAGLYGKILPVDTAKSLKKERRFFFRKK